ncbi:sugar kinase [Paracoccus sp. (in: a-proteobacteria)]|uniref:sugar kinase n=1 Tax=Paracoccus sp. TaxID=267 RepID=UPI00396C8F9F
MDFLCIGEPLIEFTNCPETPGRFDRRAGGDMLNTAVYLARLTAPGSVGYLSRLGDDAMSGFLRGTLAEEGIANFCATQPGGRPGLSFITTDPRGERSFTYWRDQSPARRLFSAPEDLAALDGADTLVLSGVTLAMLLPEGRAALLDALERRRAEGARIVLDTNYRPALWLDAGTARAVIGRAAGRATLILPSLDDVSDCFGTTDPSEAMHLLMNLTAAEIVLTTGGDAVTHRATGATTFDSWPLPPRRTAVDTTGAGDSFNAGWLAARQAGLAPPDAIARAAGLAAQVVLHQGAILPCHAMPAIKEMSA